MAERVLRLRAELAEAEQDLELRLGLVGAVRSLKAAKRVKRPWGCKAKVLELAQGVVTASQAALETGYPEHSCRAAISKLAAAGLVERIGGMGGAVKAREMLDDGDVMVGPYLPGRMHG